MSQNEDMLDGFNTILDLQMYWQIFEQQYLDAEHQQSYQSVIEPLAKLYSYMIEYQAQVLHHLDSSQASRAWADISGSTSWSGSTENIKKLDEFCRGFISIGESSEIRKYREEQLQVLLQTREFNKKIFQHMVDHEREEQERQVLNDFAKAAGDYKLYKDRNPMRVAGTCEWFLQDERFTKWNSSGSSDLLWATAQPGCGKSVLSKSLIDEGHLDSQTTFTITSDSVIPSPKPVVAYFFFKEGGEGKMDASHALSALLHQIFTLSSSSLAINHAIAVHKAHGTTLTSKFSELWQILVDSSTGSEACEIICVLDALDECDKDSRRWILEKLESFYSDEDVRSRSKLKFLVTSRPISELEYRFDNFPKNTAYMRLDGDEKHDLIREEIDLFIDAEVEVLTRKFNDRSRSATKIKARLKSMENRTYLWLYLTLDYIKSEPAKFARASDVEKLLSHLPGNVSEAYERMLSGKRNDRRTEILLQLVLAAQRPLTLTEANIALTIGLQERVDSHETLMDELWSPEAFEDVVKDLCGLLISIHDSQLLFIHQTAREFLTKRSSGLKQEGDNLNWEGRFSTEQPHNTMLKICLDYLLIPDLGGPADADGRLNGTFIHVYSLPFLSYSANNWHFHFMHCGNTAFDANLYRVRMICDPDDRWVLPWAFIHVRLWMMLYDNSGLTPLSIAAYFGLNRFASILLKDGYDIGEGLETSLRLAADQGHEKMVRMLLEHGADPCSKDPLTSTALMNACSNGHFRVAQILLDHGSDSNDQYRERGEALEASAFYGHDKVFKLLLGYGADVNTIGPHGGTALRAAVERENNRIFQILLDHGADVNISHGSNGTALQAAALNGNQMMLEKLIHHGAEIDAISRPRYGPTGSTALQTATAEERQDIFDLLLLHGANVDIQGSSGTALHEAASISNLGMVKTLLGHGACATIKSIRGSTPLHEVSRSYGGDKNIVELLLSHGANVNAQDSDYCTALHYASSRGHKDVVDVLIRHGATLNGANRNGQTALYLASSAGHLNVVEILLLHGATVNNFPGGDAIELHVALVEGYQDIVETLIRHGADINLEGHGGRSALWYAAYSTKRAAIELLLDHGVRVNPSLNGQSALQIAAAMGYDEGVKILLNRQADVNIISKGITALYEAAEKGHLTVVETLLDHGADINLGDFGESPLSIAAEIGCGGVVEALLCRGADMSPKEGYEPAFFKASRNGHSEVVELFLDHGFDVNHEHSCETALLLAVEGWHQKVVELLLERGADANQKPVLHKAAASGLPKMVEVLLDHGAEPDLHDEDHHTTLYYAAENGHERIVEILLEHDEIGSTHEALEVAMANEHMEIVEMLQKRGSFTH